jgi:NDP-sugar pyrophosphorylase family protein
LYKSLLITQIRYKGKNLIEVTLSISIFFGIYLLQGSVFAHKASKRRTSLQEDEIICNRIMDDFSKDSLKAIIKGHKSLLPTNKVIATEIH